MSEKSSKIYIDIAAWFDLRHSALYQILGEEKTLEMVCTHDYNLREQDRFEGVDEKLLKAYLECGDTRMLESAPMSYIQVAAASKIANIEKRNSFTGEGMEPEAVFNIYPFTLNEKQCELLREGIFIKLGQCCKVTIVREEPKTLSPHYLKNTGFIACFMYNLHGWLAHHATAVGSGDLKEVIMYFAAIYEKAPDKEEEKLFKKLGFKDPFSYTEYLFTGHMQLVFLPVFMYSSLVTATVFLDANKDALKPPPMKEKMKEDES